MWWVVEIWSIEIELYIPDVVRNPAATNAPQLIGHHIKTASLRTASENIHRALPRKNELGELVIRS